MKRYRFVGLIVSGAHLILWVVVLLLRRGTVYYGDPDWNLLPYGTIWYDAYAVLNVPVHLAYGPLGDLLFERFRHGIYDVELSAFEVAVNYAFHLVAFAVWWYILGLLFAFVFDKLRHRTKPTQRTAEAP